MDIKNYDIRQFLAEQGILPTKERNGYGMYLSPLRNEKTSSFKVDYNRNLWYDFGTDEGGSIIDIVMKLENCSVGEAIAKLENKSSFSFHRSESTYNVQSTMKVTSVESLRNRYLIEYLQNKRSINLDIAKKYCKEVHYTINDKPFFAIGFKSDEGGWELRNEYFKGGTSPKGITTVENNSDTCLVFEGFIDMLSYLTLKKAVKPSIDIVVLNSVNNLSRAEVFLKNHQIIHCFLDNDEAGKRAIATIMKLGVEVVDQSPFYRKYKDINEYLMKHRETPKQKQVVKPRLR